MTDLYGLSLFKRIEPSEDIKRIVRETTSNRDNIFSLGDLGLRKYKFPRRQNWSVVSEYKTTNNTFKTKSLADLDLNVDSFYHGIDWIYSFLDTMLMYDYTYIYMGFFLTYFDEAYDYVFKIFWFFTNELNSFQLFYSILLDKYLTSLLYSFPFIQSWYKNILVSKETTFLLLNHPEILFINNSIIVSFIFKYTGYLTHTMTNLLISETFINASLMFIHLIFIIGFILMGLLLYFSFFTSSTKEENLVDNDHMLANITIEAEEEIASMDDIIMLFCLLLYIYGWFFYSHFWYLATKVPEFILLIYLFPFLYYIIVFIPTLLLYDFGIFFVAYLRGVASLPVFILELVFDFVALMAFYIRILVQGVRLLLMVFTYASLHDFILYYSFDQRLWKGDESIFDEWNNMWVSNGSFSFFFFITILARLYYWLYELLHTFFVVTAQFIAFFAMVFWLFFFLYTFFSYEKHEAYFSEKRELFIQYWRTKLK